MIVKGLSITDNPVPRPLVLFKLQTGKIQQWVFKYFHAHKAVNFSRYAFYTPY